LRTGLAQEGAEELGFGLSDDGQSWALLARLAGDHDLARNATCTISI
jgi:hypothetical protein